MGPWINALASAAGITAYLPVDLPARQQRQVALLFALADEPLLRRPVSIAAVERAMVRACPRDPGLCEAIEPWLSPYRAPAAVTLLEAEAAVSDETRVSLPNRQGLSSADPWQLRLGAHWQPARGVLISGGAMLRKGEFVPSGTVLSAGNEYARLDIGFQDRWASPLTDSAFMQSTQAATMASVSVSNEKPITRAGLRYQAQLSRLSYSRNIVDGNTLTRGHPLLAALHVSVQPVPGWSLAGARQLQYGGGSRESDMVSLLKAFFAPNLYDNFRAGRPEEFGNQQAAWSSSFVYPGSTPLVVSMEYAGEDTSHGTPGRLGNAGLSLGLHAPRLWRSAGLRYEISEWQNSWYVHHLYVDGLVNRGQMLGHWGAAWRAPQDSVGGRSHLLGLQWEMSGGRMLDLQWRTLVNQSYTGVAYGRATQWAARFEAPLGRVQAGTELLLGRDVFGDRYYRLAAFARMGQGRAVAAAGMEPANANPSASMFVDVGAAASRVRLSRSSPGSSVQTSALRLAPHLGVGLRREVGARTDLGVRLELDRIDDHTLIAVRALDYRYRLGRSLALTAFAGAARLDLATPAYGYYAGGGLQWRDVRPGWDAGLDVRYGDKLARDELQPGGALLGNVDSFNDVYSASFYLSRRF